MKKITYITVYINGKPFNCHLSMTIKDFLLYLNFDLDLIVIEYNYQVMDISQYDNTILKMNDSIEVITIVGGG
uniref:Thiamin biosynthesis protein S n=1 Tax=Taenioma perpusillum TaxID=210852 RepID=A0A1Z1MR65_9FLOR|nr:thiamin biosynthesis protein S [Taenioma perpusillum]ARW68593.1 thiamin biosynthesis protein S [Taenioma perpusillum]